MASIDITTQSGAVGNGDLQLQNGAPMDGTLRLVTDALNTASPLKLSTSLVQTTSTLKITTNDNPYIDAEDGSGNNRFTVGRAPASQQVNVDFASNPAGSTTAVGAIRTYRDGTNLSEAMTFIEDGSVGIGTTAPVGILDLFKAAAATRLAIRGDAGQNRLISYRTGALQRFGLYVNNTAESGANAGSNFAIRAYDDAGTLLSTPLFIERSSGNVGIGTATPLTKLDVNGAASISGNVTIDTTTLVVDAAGDRVIMGAGSALQGDTLEVHAKSNSGAISVFGRASDNGSAISFRSNGAATQKAQIYGSDAGLGFSTGTTERMLITSDAYVRLASGTGGIQFNGDTAAANALDDYEEGTWTMGVAFGAASTGVTYTSNTGTYTKIGRQVTVNGYLVLSNKGSSTGIAQITGLPFTIGNLDSYYSSPSLYLNRVTFANQFQGYGNKNATTIDIVEVTEAGIISSLTNADFANNSEIIVTLTYFTS